MSEPAFIGPVLVFATFGLARLVLPDGPSLAAAAASAVTPLFVVHARIFKEDIFVAAFLVLARRADQVAAGAGAAPRHPGRPPHRTCRRLPSLWLPSLHYRCRCGSTLPMSIRARSFLLLCESGARVIFDVLRPTKDMADIVVTANLSYDRFDFLVPRKGSASEARAAYYGELASRPHLDVSNGRPTVAHFNPVVRIVALDGSVPRLQKIAAEIRAAAPGLTVRLIDQAPKSKE